MILHKVDIEKYNLFKDKFVNTSLEESVKYTKMIQVENKDINIYDKSINVLIGQINSVALQG